MRRPPRTWPRQSLGAFRLSPDHPPDDRPRSRVSRRQHPVNASVRPAFVSSDSPPMIRWYQAYAGDPEVASDAVAEAFAPALRRGDAILHPPPAPRDEVPRRRVAAATFALLIAAVGFVVAIHAFQGQRSGDRRLPHARPHAGDESQRGTRLDEPERVARVPARAGRRCERSGMPEERLSRTRVCSAERPPAPLQEGSLS